MHFRYLSVLLLFFGGEVSGNYFEELQQFWVQEVKELPIYEYPCENVVAALKKQGKSSFTLFGYGSLLDCRSARRTITEQSWESRRAALAFGVKRMFNRDVPITPDWGEALSPLARGMLNIEITDTLFDIVNGITLTVSLDEIEPLCKREVGYDLVPLVCIDWEESLTAQKPRFYVAYAFRAPCDSVYINKEIVPRSGYYERTRDASKNYGLLYYTLWMNTTYCADGVTPITHWENTLGD